MLSSSCTMWAAFKTIWKLHLVHNAAARILFMTMNFLVSTFLASLVSAQFNMLDLITEALKNVGSTHLIPEMNLSEHFISGTFLSAPSNRYAVSMCGSGILKMQFLPCRLALRYPGSFFRWALKISPSLLLPLPHFSNLQCVKDLIFILYSTVAFKVSGHFILFFFCKIGVLVFFCHLNAMIHLTVI